MQSWRINFGEPKCPFIVIQLPNFTNDNWPIIREAQLKTVLNDPNTCLVVTIGLGDSNQLHPPDKQDVGHRAALASLNLVYGQTVVYSGPIFTKESVLGGVVTFTFDQVGAGLMVGKRDVPPKQLLAPTIEVPNGTLSGFEIAGSDGRFLPATAKITGTDTVEVSSPDLSAPEAVRYAWAGALTCNLYNKIEDNSGQVIDGLPASPFRYGETVLVTSHRNKDLREGFNRKKSRNCFSVLELR
jgi:sialate O-acetylesterase